MEISTIKKLNNGVQIPCIGMGTYPLKGRAMTKAVVAATTYGYRAFDTAKAYGNEKHLGNALKKAYIKNGIKRASVFLTSKIGENLDNGIPDGKLFYSTSPNEKKDIKKIVANQLDDILKQLQTDYLDLLLIHWPFPEYFVEIWKAMEDEYKKGRVRTVGVSNFEERHLLKILDSCTITPMVNQVELHPLNTKKKLLTFCQSQNIQIQAYSPLLVMNRKLQEAYILKNLSEKYNKSIPQIILRWHIQNDVIPIPKSGNPIRLHENIDIFNFELTEKDVVEIDLLNENYSGLVASKYCPGY